MNRPNPWDMNLSGGALHAIRAVLESEANELRRFQVNASPAFLALYPKGKDPTTLNLAKIAAMVADINAILTP